MENFDIAVVGGGLAGKIAAIALAHAGYNVALVGPKGERADGRTTALMAHSIAFMEKLGLWQRIAPHAAALSTMQIVDGTDRLFRAPTVPFRAADIGHDAFGYNFPNAPALLALDEAIGETENITLFSEKVVNAEVTQQPVRLELSDGEIISAAIAVGADGRESPLRNAAGIGVKRWSYPQTAIVLNFKHEVPHGNASTEFHTPSGPFTQVPLPGMRSSLVWVLDPQDAVIFLQLSAREMAARIEARMQSMLGKVEVDGGVQAWPMAGMTANHFGKGPLVLVGEATHVFPPIGAQGLNLSLRDIMDICDLLGEKKDDMNIPAIGDAFDRRRRPDVLSRTASVHMLNRSLLSSFLPTQFMRAAGMHVLDHVPPLRNMVMREGIAPGESLRSITSSLREKIGRKRA